MRKYLFVLSMMLPLFARADLEAGGVLAMQGDGKGTVACMTCHGASGEGNAAGGFPVLAGLDGDYLFRQMRDYQSGARASAVMAPLIANLDEAQLRDVSDWYAALPAPVLPALPPVDADLLEQGRRLVEAGDWNTYIVPCVTCHGADASGVGSAFPALAGQHAGYLRQQLLAWREGQRSNDPDQLMLAIAARLDDAQMTAVSEYLARLPRTGAQP